MPRVAAQRLLRHGTRRALHGFQDAAISMEDDMARQDDTPAPRAIQELADVVAVIGSFDIVVPEIDR